MDFSAYNMEPLNWSEIFEGAFLMFLFVGSIALAFVSRRWYLLLSAGVSVIQAVGFLVTPTTALANFSFLEKNLEIDGVHLHLMRCFGVLILAEAVICYRLSDRDTDPTIFTSIVWARVVLSVLFAINVVYSFLSSSVSKTKSTLWKSSEVMIGMMVLTITTNVLSSLVQLYRCASWGGYPEAFSRLNVHIRIDYFFILLCGILGFALPHWFISLETTIVKAGHMHLYLLRAIGIVMIGNALLMGRAPNFLRDNDKVTLLECRIIQNVALIILMLYAQNWYDVFTSYHAYLDMGGVALWTLNAAFGYWAAKGYPKLHTN